MLKARDDEVAGLCRRPDQGEALRMMEVAEILGALATPGEGRLIDMVSGSDAIVFTAGTGVEDDDAMTDAVGGERVTKCIVVAMPAGARRVVLVSVFPEAGQGGRVDEGFEHYIAVKKRADVELARPNPNWIILPPSSLTNDGGVGTVSLEPVRFFPNRTDFRFPAGSAVWPSDVVPLHPDSP